MERRITAEQVTKISTLCATRWVPAAEVDRLAARFADHAQGDARLTQAWAWNTIASLGAFPTRPRTMPRPRRLARPTNVD